MRTRDGLLQDLEGAEHPDLEAARGEAMSAAKELCAEALLSGTSLADALDRSYEVTDETGAVVFTVTFEEAANADDHRP